MSDLSNDRAPFPEKASSFHEWGDSWHPPGCRNFGALPGHRRRILEACSAAPDGLAPTYNIACGQQAGEQAIQEADLHPVQPRQWHSMVRPSGCGSAVLCKAIANVSTLARLTVSGDSSRPI
ncbi:hypothetical protein CEXT_798951 [Caerostris extrusa]|uniref:Uncharacterized protein n=1 Tax=Caerostris extrusa TaxID=172846 RepID=A0AAV4VJY0_CAEEX|nr:hypothetical protein CEXT_798951 [Caerostris extrusa]